VEILLITPEIAPYSRSGELGDVCAALPKALRGLGHKVTVISPLWAGIDATARGLARRLSSVEVDLGAHRYACTLHDGRTTGGVELVFVGHAEVFAHAPGSGPASADAQALAALVLSQAAAQVAAARPTAPEVVHAHSWLAAAALPLVQAALPNAARVLSLHDARSQGPLSELPSGVALPPALRESAGAEGASLLLAGVTAASRAVASSHDEAERLRAGHTPLARALQAGNKLIGIPNGLDAARWNPLTDPLLPSRFDPADLTGKARCKDALQLELDLPIAPDVPLVACLGGGVDADGTSLLAQVADRLLSGDVQLVVLGGDAAQRAALEHVGARFDDRLRLPAAGDERLQHRLIAGADLVLVPDHDPLYGDLHLCAQRYGAPPIVRKAGAMADAVVDCDAELLTGNGFVFEAATTEDMLAATQRAVAAFSDKKAFEGLRKRVMKLDVSWERSARRYEYAYREILGARS
jgi:starch synthase